MSICTFVYGASGSGRAARAFTAPCAGTRMCSRAKGAFDDPPDFPRNVLHPARLPARQVATHHPAHPPARQVATRYFAPLPPRQVATPHPAHPSARQVAPHQPPRLPARQVAPHRPARLPHLPARQVAPHHPELTDLALATSFPSSDHPNKPASAGFCSQAQASCSRSRAACFARAFHSRIRCGYPTN
jgi:hypothetical protein